MVANISNSVNNPNIRIYATIPNKSPQPVDKAPINTTQQTTQAAPNLVTNNFRIRTTLSTSDEISKYSTILEMLEQKDKKAIERLLARGILLNSNSDNHSTVLDNLYKIATTQRANGLDSKNILKWTIRTIDYPYIITQKFGDIPRKYRKEAEELFKYSKTGASERGEKLSDMNVQNSCTCVAASLEFKLANQLPAEFSRYVQELSSPQLAVNKNVNLTNLADHVLDRITLLKMFNTEANEKEMNFNTAKILIRPDKNAILRAKIQTTHKDSIERSPVDVLVQSAFMNLGSQKTYNSLTDKRAGIFNQSDTGLNEFEKTFDESIIFGKNIISAVYQEMEQDGDNGIKITGYKTDFQTIKKQLLATLNRGENVIIGCSHIDNKNYVRGGHEFTIVSYKKDPITGKIKFICNDTDDDNPAPVVYSEEKLLPLIHHAALPKDIADQDYDKEADGLETINLFKTRMSARNNI